MPVVTCLPLRGLMEVNCYLYADEETGHGFLIDPGAQGRRLWEWIQAQGLVIERVLLTHGHFDHIGGLRDICADGGIPAWIHEAGEEYLRDPTMNLSSHFRERITFAGAHHFRDGDVIVLEANPAYSLRVIHTPGHTRDSVLLYDERRGFAFSGDTIFLGNRGNDTFPGGDGVQLLRSIREKVMTLPGETILYPGHGEATTVDAERPLYV